MPRSEKQLHAIRRSKISGVKVALHIAERLVELAFPRLNRMPYANPGFDFLGPTGCKVDVKYSSRLYQRWGSPIWSFCTKHNTDADIFVCVALDNRENLTLEHVWLFKSEDVKHLTNITITESTINKWNEHELPIDFFVDAVLELHNIIHREDSSADI